MNTIHRSPANDIAEDDIQAFVDGVLDDERRNEILAHIVANPREAERVNAYFRQRAALERLGAALEPDDSELFCPELQRGIAAALARQRAVRHGLRIAAGILIALPLAAGGWWLSSYHAGPATQVAAVTPEQSFDPIFPFGGGFKPVDMDVVESGAESLALLDSRLEKASLVVPDLAAIGLRLIGGDTVREIDPPAARLVYADELGNPLFVYVGLAAGDAPLAFTLAPEGHISLSWRDGPLVFAVVGPMDMPRLLDVMRLVSKGITDVTESPQPLATPPVQAEVQPAVLPEAEIDPALAPATKAAPSDQPALPTTGPGELGKEQPKVL
jgi:anti-sigma factor RsiW